MRRLGADAIGKAGQEYLPAAGTNAAANWRDYGRPRGQLSYNYNDCRRSRKSPSGDFIKDCIAFAT